MKWWERPEVVNAQTCACTQTEQRRRTRTNGTIALVRQCLRCGRQVGPALPQAGVQLATLPAWDEGLPERWYQQFQQTIETAKASTDKDWWTRYEAHLQSPKWASIRARVIARAGGLCEGCREREGYQVHHLTYTHLGDELLYELVLLCDGCHERAHEHTEDA